MNRSRTAAVALLTLALTTAGCAGVGPGATTSATEPRTTASASHAGTETTASHAETTTTTVRGGTATATPLPPGSVDVPDGPKALPGRPATLNRSSVREYVRTVEYRVAYNSLWINEYTEVTLACRVDDVTERPWGYEAVVTCTGHSDTEVPANATATPGPHGDWFTQSFRYRVGGNATHRERVDARSPVP